MNAELISVVLLGLGYLGLLFGCGLAVERGWVPVRITRHPMVYTLALGVYASAWAIYGSIELAANAGFGYLAYYLGPAGAFFACPRAAGTDSAHHPHLPALLAGRSVRLSLPLPLGRHAGDAIESACRTAAAGHTGANLERCRAAAHRQPL